MWLEAIAAVISFCHLMERRTVEVRVAGVTYRVVSSAQKDELQRLTNAVEVKLDEVCRGRAQPGQALLLAALALAHDVAEERERRERLERNTRDFLRQILSRLDSAFDLPSAASELGSPPE